MWNGAAVTSCGVQGAFKNLKVQVTSSTAVAVTADADCLYNGSTFAYVTGVSATANTSGSSSCAAGTVNCLDTGTLAASTWYSVWIIYNGTAVATLLSASATAPTLPTGYIYYARVGWVRTNSSLGLLGTLQMGRQAHYVVGGANLSGLPLMASGLAGSITTPTWSGVSVSGFVPPTASQISVVTYTLSGYGIAVAPNSSYGAYSSTSNPPPVQPSSRVSGAGTATTDIALIPLESTTIYWAGENSGANPALYTFGWEDNL